MLPDLGKYADTVLFAYGATIIIVAALIVSILRRNARVRRALQVIEARRGKR